MTDKKEKIVEAALELFANEGYNATPTCKIAKKAGVSEGLIFRHFKNKKGLLEAINAEAEARYRDVVSPILFETDPKMVIKKTIEMPFNVDKSQFDFWKLQFKLKWEEEYFNPNKVKPLIDKLTTAFERLGYKDPLFESIKLNHILEAISIDIIRDNLAEQQLYKEFLLRKYSI
jgi:AcrR family transcriptional regulator